MSDELVKFLAARLAEDEAEAKGPPGWKLEHWTAVRYADKDSGRNWRVDAEPRCVVDAVAEEDAKFIATHDPARLLREVAAKRAILTEWKAVRKLQGLIDAKPDTPSDRYRDWVLRHLASAYSDHPDYRPE